MQRLRVVQSRNNFWLNKTSSFRNELGILNKQKFIIKSELENLKSENSNFSDSGRATLKLNKLASKFKFRKKNSKVIKIKSGRSRSIKDIFTLSHDVNPARFKSLEMRSVIFYSHVTYWGQIGSFPESTCFQDEQRFTNRIVLSL